MAVDADFSFRGDVPMFKMCISLPSHVGCTDLRLVSGNMSPICFSLTSCAVTGSLQDQLRDFIRLRNKGQVTRFNFYGLGAHALGHESLEVRIDRAVLGRDGVIARL